MGICDRKYMFGDKSKFEWSKHAQKRSARKKKILSFNMGHYPSYVKKSVPLYNPFKNLHRLRESGEET